MSNREICGTELNILISYGSCICFVQFIMTIAVYIISFLTKPYMVFIILFVFLNSCLGLLVIRKYDNNPHQNAAIKILPLGIILMVIFTFLPFVGLLFVIWSKGFKNCIFEGVMSIFELIFLSFWLSIYYESDENVRETFPDIENNQKTFTLKLPSPSELVANANKKLGIEKTQESNEEKP